MRAEVVSLGDDAAKQRMVFPLRHVIAGNEERGFDPCSFQRVEDVFGSLPVLAAREDQRDVSARRLAADDPALIECPTTVGLRRGAAGHEQASAGKTRACDKSGPPARPDTVCRG